MSTFFFFFKGGLSIGLIRTSSMIFVNKGCASAPTGLIAFFIQGCYIFFPFLSAFHFLPLSYLPQSLLPLHITIFLTFHLLPLSSFTPFLAPFTTRLAPYFPLKPIPLTSTSLSTLYHLPPRIYPPLLFFSNVHLLSQFIMVRLIFLLMFQCKSRSIFPTSCYAITYTYILGHSGATQTFK